MQALWNALRELVLPGGATSGQRIEINVGNSGDIVGYYADGNVAFSLTISPAEAISCFSDDATPARASLFNGSLVVSDANNVNSFNNMMQLSGTGAGDGSQNMELFDASGNASHLTIRKGGIPGFGAVALIPANQAWTAPTYSSLWAGGSTITSIYKQLRYRVDNEDHIELAGAFHTTGVAGNTVFVLPASYCPVDTYETICWATTAGSDNLDVPARLQINSNGNVVIAKSTAFAANQNFYIPSVIFPYGNIS